MLVIVVEDRQDQTTHKPDIRQNCESSSTPTVELDTFQGSAVISVGDYLFVGDGEVSALVLVGDPFAPSTVQAI
jgi:hypothetical protein